VAKGNADEPPTANGMNEQWWKNNPPQGKSPATIVMPATDMYRPLPSAPQGGKEVPVTTAPGPQPTPGPQLQPTQGPELQPAPPPPLQPAPTWVPVGEQAPSSGPRLEPPSGPRLEPPQ